MSYRVALGVLVVLAAAATVSAQTTRTVCASGCTYTNDQLQTAINASAGGDTILLQEGYTYTGVFVLRANTTTSYITMRTGVSSTGSVLASNLFPASNIRATHALYQARYAKLQSPNFNEPAIRTVRVNETGSRCAAEPCLANYWRLQWLEFLWNSANYLQELVDLGGNEPIGGTITNAQDLRSEIPHHFEVIQVLFTGHPVRGQQRGLGIFANTVTVQDSSFQDIKGIGSDGQSIFINNSQGPYTITNNELSAGTEPLMAGGDGQKVVQTQSITASTTTTVTLAAVTDLQVGQGIACTDGTSAYVGEVTDITSLTVTFTPEWPSAAPLSWQCKWSIVPGDLTFTKNHVVRPLAWRSPIVGTPTGVTTAALSTGGTLAAGNYCYRITARHTVSGGTARSTASTEVCRTTTGSTSRVQINWTPVTNAETYYIYGRTSGAQNIRWSVDTSACTSTTCTYIDTGSAGTSENVPTSTGTIWLVKNLFELKNMDTALIEGNHFEGNWAGGQAGYGILFTEASSAWDSPSTTVRSITFRHNKVIGGCAFAQINGSDVASGFRLSLLGKDFTITNNLVVLDTAATCLSGGSDYYIYLAGVGDSGSYPRQAPQNISITHNTFLWPYPGGQRTGVLHNLGAGGVDYLVGNFLFDDNILRRGSVAQQMMIYSKSPGGFQDESTSMSIILSATGASVDNNVMGGTTSCSAYPGTNFCIDESTFQAQFEDYAGGDYRLDAASSYNNAATDGTDIGANIDTIEALTDIALSGDNTGGTPPPPVTITTTSLPNGTVGTAYSQTLQLTGGTSTFTWTVSSGTLPTGLSLSTAGVISGTPSAQGVFAFVVQVVDSASPQQSDTQSLSITVSAAAVPLSITTTTVADGEVPIPYEVQLAASGGTAPYIWSLSSGTLPPGVTLSAGGLLAGVPTTAGTYNFTVGVTDTESATDTQALALTVDAESRPCDRPISVNRTAKVSFRGPTAPTDCVMVGDDWTDTSTSPPTEYIAILPSPVASWSQKASGAGAHTLRSHTDFSVAAPANGDLIVGAANGTFSLLPVDSLNADGGVLRYSSTGIPTVHWSRDGSSLTGLNAAELTGQVPLGVLPSVSLIPNTVTLRADANEYVFTAASIDGSDREELGASTHGHRVRLDLTNATEMRVVVQMGNAAGTTARLSVEYHNGTAFVATGIYVTMSTANNTFSGAWTSIPTAMRDGNIGLRVVATNGNGTEAPSVVNCYLQVR